MRTTDLTELLATVERIRASTSPDISATLVESIVQAEATHQEDEAAALNAIRSAFQAELDSGADAD